MKFFNLVAVLFVTAFLVACSDKPSASYIEDKVSQAIKTEYYDLLAVDKFKVHKVEKKGDDYIATLSFDIVLNASEKEIRNATLKKSNFEMVLLATSLTMTSMDHKFKKGAVVESVKEDDLTLTKKNGEWVLDI